MNFGIFGNAVATQISLMATMGDLFVVEVDKNTLWDTYLGAFPEGTNPIYKERTEHDCNCCKSFIHAVGGIVTFNGSELVSIWDIDVPDEHSYQTVADAMAAKVKEASIRGVFLYDQKKVGSALTTQLTEAGTIEWEHFHCELPKSVIKRSDAIPTMRGDRLSDKEVLERSINEISLDAAESILELIAQNTLYKGKEFKKQVQLFVKLKKAYTKLKSDREREIYCWKQAAKLKGAGRIRNSVIGTLLVDLTESGDLEGAVARYEKKTAPENYKRPTAIVTPAMIKKAQEKVVDLGYENALARRYAVAEDITINNVLFADSSVKPAMNVFDEMIKEAPKSTHNMSKVESIGIEDFLANVLPTASTIEMFVENRHTVNFMSLIAPIDKDANNMLKWDNNFSWDYNGGMADSSLRKQVADKGGRVDGALRFSHTWNYDGKNQSLMDLHVFLPTHNGQGRESDIHDSYGNDNRVGWNHRDHVRTGGTQDVDFVNPPGKSIPVENIAFPDVNKMPEGVYVMRIHNWNLRQPTTSGFKAEIEFGGQIFEYEVIRALKHKEWITVAEVTLKNGVFSIDHKLPVGSQPKEVYNLMTENFHKVTMVMNSPNHWDGNETGNKHQFFVLEDCNSGEAGRGFYNEFLSDELQEHRKVFEVLGSKLKAPECENALAGVGFSTTQTNEALFKVSGKTNRVLKVLF